MIKNYFIIACRNLFKNKVSSLINILCLAIGMCCCMLITIYIKDELSYNKFNAAYEDIYRIDLVSSSNNEIKQGAGTPLIYAPTFKTEIPQIKNIARLYQRSGSMQSQKHETSAEKKFQEQQVYFADNDFFKIFSVNFVEGNANALNTLNTIVLTRETAQKYFGTESPIGKTLLYENKIPLKVTAIIEKFPAASDLNFDFLISLESLYSVESADIATYIKTDWLFSPAITFCLLKKGQDVSDFENVLNTTLKKHGDARSKELMTVKATPLSKIHLYSSAITGNPSSNNITYIYIFAAIAFLILMIANVNFINLSTARASTRSREVGVRKVLGANRPQLIIQFLGETLVISFTAFLVAIVVARFALPLLNQLTNKQFNFHTLIQWQNIILFGIIFFIFGILAGLYPALFISRFQTVLSLKGKSGESTKRNHLGKLLLVTQFSVSTILIVCAIVIYQQLQFLKTKPLGFQKEYVLNVPIFGRGASILTYGVDGPMRKKMNAFSEELTKYSKVIAVTAASELPGQGFVPGLVIPEGFKETDNIFLPWTSVDYNFISTLKIPIIEGRDFSKSTGTDHLQAFIINESAVKRFGWKNNKDAIGKSITRGDVKNGKKGYVIAVVKDFNFLPLDQPLQPAIMDVAAARFTQFAITIQPDNIPKTLAHIKQTWDSFFPERVFEYSFLDSDINAAYKDREALSTIIQYFSLIAISLSCLGLFSLASFLSVQRTKEIGIRKVLGASVSGVLLLLSKDFLKLVILSALISAPIAWYIMNKWLENYAYHITISWWIFLLAGVFVFVITALTVGLQSIKTAMSNPIKSLRTE